MNFFHRNRYSKRGVTLVELLVVVTILMMLAAFAIPVMRPMTEGRRIREAARAIDVFLNQAKTRATLTQRPVGVLFERMTQIDRGADPVDPADDILSYQDDACNTLRMVEVPPPYAGDFSDSRVRVQNWTFLTSGGYYHIHPDTGRPQIVLKMIVREGDFSSDALIRRGDRIQFNYQGPLFTIYDDPEDNNPSDPTDSGADYQIGHQINNDGDDHIFFSTGADADPSNDDWIDTRVISLRADATDLGGVPWPSPATVSTPPLIDATNAGFLKTVGGNSTLAWSLPVPFQVLRQPQPSPVMPLRLPRDTVVDLADSGYFRPSDSAVFYGNGLYPDAFGLHGTLDAQHRGPIVLFAPNGAISSVYHWDTTGNYGRHTTIYPVFLMVGKWERTGAETVTAGSPVRSLAEDQLHNWQDASNLWMAISPQSGLVTSAEVNAPATNTAGLSVPGDPEETDPVALAAQMQVSRLFARQAQISKGALQE